MSEDNKDGFSKFINHPFLIGLLFSLYVVVIRYYIFPKYQGILLADNQLIQSFIEWFGVAYGLFIALVLVTVWSQYDTVEREFDREADAIFMLYQAVKQVGPQRYNDVAEEKSLYSILKGKINKKHTKSPVDKEKDASRVLELKETIIVRIKDYITHVINNYLHEWRNRLMRDQGDLILEEIRNTIGELIHTDEREPITSELIKEFNEVVDLRGDRITHSKQRIPKPVWSISLASSILWLIPFYGLNFSVDAIAVTLVGGVTAIVVAILVIIKDLDDPFDGTWRIDANEWEFLKEKIDPRPHLYFVFNLNNTRFHRIWSDINKVLSRNICPLYALLGKIENQTNLVNRLAKLAYLKFVFMNDFADMFQGAFVFPIVVCKLDGKLIPLINSTEINKIHNLSDLENIIQENLLLNYNNDNSIQKGEKV